MYCTLVVSGTTSTGELYVAEGNKFLSAIPRAGDGIELPTRPPIVGVVSSVVYKTHVLEPNETMIAATIHVECAGEAVQNLLSLMYWRSVR